jgi:hypothetical protein
MNKKKTQKLEFIALLKLKVTNEGFFFFSILKHLNKQIKSNKKKKKKN